MIVLANRANLDKRTALTRLHSYLQTQVTSEDSPIVRVWSHTSAGNKIGIRATVNAPRFRGFTYSVEETELDISLDFPPNQAFDFSKIQWVEPERGLMLGWHQDDSHINRGGYHFQLDYQSETIQRVEAMYLEIHPMNVFEKRMNHLVEVIDAVSGENGCPTALKEVV